MSNKIQKIVAVCAWNLFFALLTGQVFSASYTSTQDGSWTAPATWGGSATPPTPGGSASSSDDVTISTGRTITLSGETRWVGTLTVNGSSGTLSLSGSNTALNVADTVYLGGILNVSSSSLLSAMRIQGDGTAGTLNIIDGGMFRYAGPFSTSSLINQDWSGSLRNLSVKNTSNGATHSRYVGNLQIQNTGILEIGSGTSTAGYATIQGMISLLGNAEIKVSGERNAFFNITKITPKSGSSDVYFNPTARAALVTGTGQTTTFTGTSQSSSKIMLANVSLTNTGAAGTNVSVNAAYVGGGLLMDAASQNTLVVDKATLQVTQETGQAGIDLGGINNTLKLTSATITGVTLSNVKADILLEDDGTLKNVDLVSYTTTNSYVLITGAKILEMEGGSTINGSLMDVTSLVSKDTGNRVTQSLTAGGNLTTSGTGTTTIGGNLIMGANSLTVGDGIDSTKLYVDGSISHTGSLKVSSRGTLGFHSSSTETVTIDAGGIIEAYGGNLSVSLNPGTFSSTNNAIGLNSTATGTLTVKNLNLGSSGFNRSIVVTAASSGEHVTTIEGLVASTTNQLILGNNTKIVLTQISSAPVTLTGSSGFAITGSGIGDSILTLDFSPADDTQRDAIWDRIDHDNVVVYTTSNWQDESNIILNFDTLKKENVYETIITREAKSSIIGEGSLKVTDRWEIQGNSITTHEMQIAKDTTVDVKNITRTGSTPLTRLDITGGTTGGGIMKISGAVTNINEIYFHAGSNYFNGTMTGKITVGDATLYGTGTVVGGVVFTSQNSVHRPGNSIGTQTAGSWTYAGGSKIYIEISSSGCDLIRATDGNIMFSKDGANAATNIILLNNGTFEGTNVTYDIMKTTDGRFVTGAGTTISDGTVTASGGVSAFGGTDGFDITAFGDDLVLNYATLYSSGSGTTLMVNVSGEGTEPPIPQTYTDNQQVVYDNLRALMLAGNEDAGELFERTVEADTRVTAKNMDLLTTIALTATPTITQITAEGFHNTVINRTHRVLNAAMSAGLIQSSCCPEAVPGWGGGCYGGGCYAGVMDEETRILAQCMEVNPFCRQFWFQGAGNWMRKKDDFLGNYGADTFGFSIGMDRMLCCNFLWGISLGGNWTNTNFKNSGSSCNISSFMLNMYGSYFADCGYLTANVGGMFSKIDSDRFMAYDGSTASGSHSGNLFTVGVEMGRKSYFLAADFNPFLGFQFMDMSENAFDESGSLAALHVDKHSHQSFLQTLGFRLSRFYQSAYGWSLEPVLTFAWVHDYCNGGISATSYFLFDDTRSSMLATGYGIPRDRALISADVNLNTACGREIFFRYAGEFNGHFGSHTFQGGVTFCF